MKHYCHFSIREREEISCMLATGKSFRQIAKFLFRSPSSVSREIRRNGLKRSAYRAVIGHARAIKYLAKPRKARKMDIHTDLKNEVISRLLNRWSPQQIARDLKRHYPNRPEMTISHESIYSYIYVFARGTLKKSLIEHLRKYHNVRGSRKKDRSKYSPIKDIVSIDERPKEVEDRIIPGHWEGDLLVGPMNQSFLGTLVERTTRFTLLIPVKSRDTLVVKDAFSKMARKIPEHLRMSMTYDRGCEMKHHRLFTQETNMKVYFAHPHCPWERGTNENTNGILRDDWFPKKTDFSKLSDEYIEHVQTLFNDRPRKVIDWRSPAEAYNELLHL